MMTEADRIAIEEDLARRDEELRYISFYNEADDSDRIFYVVFMHEWNGVKDFEIEKGQYPGDNVDFIDLFDFYSEAYAKYKELAARRTESDTEIYIYKYNDNTGSMTKLFADHG